MSRPVKMSQKGMLLRLGSCDLVYKARKLIRRCITTFSSAEETISPKKTGTVILHFRKIRPLGIKDTHDNT